MADMGELIGILSLIVLAMATEYGVAWAGSVLSSISSEETRYATFTFRDDRSMPMTTNILMNVCIPNVAMIFIFMIIRKFAIPFVEPYLIWYVTAFFVFRMVLICVLLRRKELYSPVYELGMAASGIALAYFLIHFFFAAEEAVFITASELREELWFVVLIVLYQFFKMIFDKNVTQNKVLKEGQITKYIIHKFNRFLKRYQHLLDVNTQNRYICILLYAVMIFEDYNRGPVVRRLERLKLRLSGKATLGIMQLPTERVISDEESVVGFYNWLEREAGEDTQFDRDGMRVRDLAWNYNNDNDYAESVTYIYNCLYEYIDQIPRYRAMFHIRELQFGQDEDGTGRAVQPYRVVTAVSQEEFVRVLDSHVYLKCGTEAVYLPEMPNDHPFLAIHGLGHVYLDGDGSKLYIRQINFQNCHNLVLDNWLIRSADWQENVSAAVLRFVDCENVQLKNLDFSGGTRCRIESHRSSVQVRNCRIHGCASGGILLQDSEAQIEGLQIDGCGNSDENILTFAGGNVFLSDVQITDNRTTMFAISLSDAGVICKQVEVRQNVFAGLSDGEIVDGIKEQDNVMIAAG